MFLLRLKRETLPQHTRLERQIDVTHLCASQANYTEHLARMYGFYRPLEDALWRTNVVRKAQLGDERRKTPLLARDLTALGKSPDALPLCETFAEYVDDARALGICYVLEGASLGGQVITRLVRERLGITPDSGGAFFYGYGPETATMWETFRAFLTEYACDDARQGATVAAANATFAALGSWLESQKETDIG